MPLFSCGNLGAESHDLVDLQWQSRMRLALCNPFVTPHGYELHRRHGKQMIAVWHPERRYSRRRETYYMNVLQKQWKPLLSTRPNQGIGMKPISSLNSLKNDCVPHVCSNFLLQSYKAVRVPFRRQPIRCPECSGKHAGGDLSKFPNASHSRHLERSPN